MSTEPPIGRRSRGPLISLWTVVLAVIGALWYIEVQLPALHDIFAPFYVILAAVAAVGTWRWARTRGRHERRRDDRRHTDRRHGGEPSPRA